MCGIVGYIGNEDIKKELLTRLKKLEYRGYDSAGIAVNDNGINVYKVAGNISNLDDVEVVSGGCGIAHTRWATHGKPDIANAHPHLSSDKSWAVVHNGIIENYQDLRTKLIDKFDTEFVSETDTEVIAQMLGVESTSSGMHRLINVCKKLTGSYALACLNSSKPDTIYLAKNKSPLYVATNGSETIIASDPICFSDITNKYYSLEDNEFAEVNGNNVVFYDKNYNKIVKNTHTLNIKIDDYDKLQYPHYMLKEINEVPAVLDRIYKTYLDNRALEHIDREFISKFDNITIIGCGTAYHAGLMGAKYIEKFARLRTRVYIASEFIYSSPIINDRTLCILVSQSGETADTLTACKLARDLGATTIALTNVLYSTLSKMVDIVLPVCAGPEIAVACTKAYTAQVAEFYMLARHLSNVLLGTNYDYLSDMKYLADNITMPSCANLNKFADLLRDKEKVFFIGRDFDYVTCEEASLKLKEITYINCASHPAGELKHGFLALVDSESIVFVVCTEKDLLPKTLSGAHEALARGGKVIFVSQFDISTLGDCYDYYQLPNFDESLMPLISIGFFQTISYLTSVKKSINPDKPRNLAKSVTVE